MIISMLSGNLPVPWFLLLQYSIACIFFCSFLPFLSLQFWVCFFNFAWFYSWQHFCIRISLPLILLPPISLCQLQSSLTSAEDLRDPISQVNLPRYCSAMKDASVFAPLFCMLCFPAEHLLSFEYNYELHSSLSTETLH